MFVANRRFNMSSAAFKGSLQWLMSNAAQAATDAERYCSHLLKSKQHGEASSSTAGPDKVVAGASSNVGAATGLASQVAVGETSAGGNCTTNADYDSSSSSCGKWTSAHDWANLAEQCRNLDAADQPYLLLQASKRAPGIWDASIVTITGKLLAGSEAFAYALHMTTDEWQEVVTGVQGQRSMERLLSAALETITPPSEDKPCWLCLNSKVVSYLRGVEHAAAEQPVHGGANRQAYLLNIAGLDVSRFCPNAVLKWGSKDACLDNIKEVLTPVNDLLLPNMQQLPLMAARLRVTAPQKLQQFNAGEHDEQQPGLDKILVHLSIVDISGRELANVPDITELQARLPKASPGHQMLLSAFLYGKGEKFTREWVLGAKLGKNNPNTGSTWQSGGASKLTGLRDYIEANVLKPVVVAIGGKPLKHPDSVLKLAVYRGANIKFFRLDSLKQAIQHVVAMKTKKSKGCYTGPAWNSRLWMSSVREYGVFAGPC
eukprot:jgi/Chrzof1/14183/Cz08g28150.t1